MFNAASLVFEQQACCGIAQLVERWTDKPGTIRTQVWFPDTTCACFSWVSQGVLKFIVHLALILGVLWKMLQNFYLNSSTVWLFFTCHNYCLLRTVGVNFVARDGMMMIGTYIYVLLFLRVLPFQVCFVLFQQQNPQCVGERGHFSWFLFFLILDSEINSQGKKITLWKIAHCGIYSMMVWGKKTPKYLGFTSVLQRFVF